MSRQPNGDWLTMMRRRRARAASAEDFMEFHHERAARLVFASRACHMLSPYFIYYADILPFICARATLPAAER